MKNKLKSAAEMKKTGVLFSVVILLFQLPIAAFGRRAFTPRTDRSELLKKGIDHGFPGFILGVQKKGEKRWIGAIGVSNIEKQTPMKINDRFHIASITKIFTATAVLRLIDQHKLSLDTKVIDILDKKLVSPIPYIDRIKVSQLLDHSSGIYGFNNDEEYIRVWLGEGVKENVHWTPEKFISLAYGDRVKPFGTPGTGHFYGDTNYVLLGLIVEKVSGQKLRKFVADQIFVPLGMHDTAYYGEEADPEHFALPTTVEGYLKRSEELDSVVKLDSSFKSAGKDLVNTTSALERIDASAGIVSTANDLLKFGRAFYDGKLLSKKAMKWYFSAGLGIEREPPGTVRQAVATVHRKKYGIFYASNGDGPGGVNATLIYHPSSKTIVVAFTNIFGLFDEIDFIDDQIFSAIIKK
ncbi:MAG: beta-lactamase family protein [Acidobacteria bacterium]|nr:beta-lactamase family protein [Acidobacteriota bacterium]